MATTDSSHSLNVAPNQLNRDFSADRPNRKRAGDISFVWTQSGWLYLAVILDLHSRRVIVWAVSNRMKRDLAIRASMSGTGKSYDNAAVETFPNTIKAELLWQRPWSTHRAAEEAIFESIEGDYKPRRRLSALGWKSPLAFEAQAA